MKLSWDGVAWSDNYYYFHWWFWLPDGTRYIGVDSMFSGGRPHWSFGLWFINVSWSLPCNVWDPDRMWSLRFPKEWQ